MPNEALPTLLAQVPDSSMYISPIKLVVVLACFVGWALLAEWMDKDAVRVNTRRQIWSMSALFTGAGLLVLLLFLPSFLASLAAYAVLMGGLGLSYVAHRNSLVVPEDKVLTKAHFQRLMRGEKPGEKKVDVKTLVQLKDAKRGKVSIPEDNAERKIYAVIQTILYDALWRRATEVDFVPAGQQTRVRVKIDGVAAEREPLERTVGESVIGFFKGHGGLDLQERRKPQKGKIAATVGEHAFEVFVKTQGSTAGERLTLRVVGDERRFKVDDLGFTEPQKEQVRRMMEADNGVVVVSALPEGGLTTSVYSFARSHDAFLQNIQMLEYEHEMDVDNITQVVYEQSDTKSFADELLKITRSDPDVVVLPVMRDKTAAKIAAEAATRKPTVYVGIHASDVFEALMRWVALVGDTGMAGKSMLGVLYQRLVRKLCPTCKTPYKPEADMLKKMNLPADQVFYRPPAAQTDKNGNPIICENCQGSGYVGRTAVFTVLECDSEIRGLIAKGASLADLKTAAGKKGGLNLQTVALARVRDGTTSVEEVKRATRPPAAPAGAAKGAPAGAA
jgi:type II secretory ATPase GspE/PulE/Tfp pilus assembly ATPase PilB-like protein